MLEGLEAIEIKINELENFKDLSSEYYLKDNILKTVYIRSKNYKLLQDLASITDGEHGSPDWDNSSNIKYITAENIKPNYILESNFNTISNKQHIKNTRSSLKENDVLIYSVGAYAGFAAKAEKHLFPANIPRSVAIARANKVSPEYLSVFINSLFT